MYPPRALDVYAPLVSDQTPSADPQQLILVRPADAQNGSAWLWSPDAGGSRARIAFWPKRPSPAPGSASPSGSASAPAHAGYLLRLSHLQLDWEHASPATSRAQGAVLYPSNELLRAPLGDYGPPPRQPAFLPAAPADMTLGVCFNSDPLEYSSVDAFTRAMFSSAPAMCSSNFHF